MKTIFEKFYDCSGVSIDTRTLQKDNFFIAIKGDNFDGNNYANEALDKGAKYAVVSDKTQANDPRKIYVEDTLIFLQELGNFHRKKIGTKLIGITGSNGKTTSKELIYSVLSQELKVLATQGNLNNHLGVPLTLLKLNSDHDLGIIEMGANKLKDIEELSNICEPDFGVITNIGKAHLEGFGGLEGVIKTKTELYQFIAENKGVLFYNKDDQRLIDNLPENCKTFSYGIDKSANVTGELLELKPEIAFQFSSNNFNSDKIETQIIGEYNFYNLLLAACIGSYFELSNKAIVNGLKAYNSKNNRSQVETTAKNNTLILDAYNANPTSVKAALESFANTQNTHRNGKCVILGDMLELGTESFVEHENIVKLTQELELRSYFIGPNFKKVQTQGAFFFADKEQAREYFVSNQMNNKLILLKGSRGIGLETLKNLF